MNRTILDFRAFDAQQQSQKPPADALDFDLTGFHAVADYIRQGLPNAKQPEPEKSDA